MDFIIDFFRSIDGIPYYIILVVNTILIFAIIGYLGEKNNEKLLKMSMNMGTTDLKSGTMNLTPTHTAPSHNSLSIPKVEATQVNSNQSVVPNQNGTPTSAVGSMTTNQSALSSNNIVNPVVNTPSAIPTINPGKPIIRPEDNEVDPNEKAPAVLIINSSDVNKDVK